MILLLRRLISTKNIINTKNIKNPKKISYDTQYETRDFTRILMVKDIRPMNYYQTRAFKKYPPNLKKDFDN